MSQDAADMPAMRDDAHYMASLSILAEQAAKREATWGTLSNAALTNRCLRELGNSQRGEPCDETYGLELFRRATLQGDPEARVRVQDCFREMVRGWLRRHPSREAACRWESEENYVALAFERLRQAVVQRQVACETLSEVLMYLRASLHGAILETLRVSRCPGAVSSPWQDGEDCPDKSEVWDRLQGLLSSERERRLAYLLYHCGLDPTEIVRDSPQEWSDVHEVARLRDIILERLMKGLICEGQTFV